VTGEGVTALVGPVLGGVALVFALLAGLITPSAGVGDRGLIGALPPTYWVGAGLAVTATVLLVRAAVHGAPQQAALVPALWIGILHTAPALAHDGVRAPLTYANVGLVQLAGSGAGLGADADPRLGWPGFFAAAVPFVVDLHPLALEWVLRLWPTLMITLAASLVAALARRAYPTVSLVGPVAALIFVVGAWTGQDHFSPQSLAFLSFLATIVIIESGPLRPRGSWSSASSLLRRFGAAGGDRPEARAVPAFVALVVLGLAAVVSHPVAPLTIGVALVVLALHGRRVAWHLALVVLVSYGMWTVVAATPWWSPQFPVLMSELSGMVPTVDLLPGAGAGGASSGLQLVGGIRTWLGVVTVASTVAVVAVMALERFRHLRPAVPLALLAVTPLVVTVLTGGPRQIITRSLICVLPLSAVLLARVVLALPASALPVTVAVGLVVVMPAFLAARYGHEAFEMVTEADLQAVELATEVAAGGRSTLVVADNPYVPWTGGPPAGTEELVAFVAVRAEPTTRWLDQVTTSASAGSHDRVVVVFTPSQSAWRQLAEGQPPQSLDRVAQWLATQPGVELVGGGTGAWVLAIDLDP
jgi:hypothetical protein